MLNVKDIVQKQFEEINHWHKQIMINANSLPMKFVQENNHWNFLLWHEEDIARIPDIEPEKMLAVKRNIDRYNQSRNNSIEEIDEWLLTFLTSKKLNQSKALHSETPGMMIDRLSILNLKLYHMQEETTRQGASLLHKAQCEEKVIILKEQITDLSACLTDVLSRLEQGKLTLKIYRQFKMYNDPDLNPQLYTKIPR
ncbi:DUF4254 domain-containing protein [Mucilaginibacter corticis]|uniref:DUF4254 domain-containing protein n=1 Tax=Mucilaginibacter corticis TaxID=2597670 RepID=A0A556MBV3_9SPHI|nr:DUF4254 domain-containing protein [Mucilaginibacter corticis]TSJ37383.1 DUF4254 domain-containing protein [Mucilaginibacter corticis]